MGGERGPTASVWTTKSLIQNNILAPANAGGPTGVLPQPPAHRFEPQRDAARPIRMHIGSKLVRDRWMGIIRLRRTQWIIAGYATVMMLTYAVGGLLIARPVPQTPADDSVAALSSAYNSSAQNLFSRLSASPGNIVFSPYSVGTAMALVMSGARGDSEAQMARVLGHSLSRADVDSANGKTHAILNQYDGRTFFAKRSAATLKTGNAVALGPQGHLIANDYLAAAKANYAAEIFRDANLAAVNKWVHRKTEGKIGQILDELDPNTAAVLLNAVYFKARWQFPFDPKSTRIEPFTISPSQTVPASIMHREVAASMIIEKDFSAIRLPYEVPQMSMVIVLPNHIGGLEAVSGQLDGAALPKIFARLQQPAGRVQLVLPRFKANFKVKLKQHFHALGMTNVFEPAQADLSGMSGRPAGLFIEDIHHRAVIEVGEEGTEAAAATAVPVLASGPPVFRATRPFLFYIVEATTNAILFQGRIVDPRSSSE